MTIQLTQETIKNYFSLPDKFRTKLLIGKNPYDFISRNSSKLIVTIGDSWTWGADLTQQKHKGLHIDKLEDDDYRLSHVYGNLVSEHFEADFLNLGESGSDNHYIAEKLNELNKIIDQLKYESVTVICVFTETARGFRGPHDHDVDYYRWLQDNLNVYSDYDNLLNFINSNVTEKILPALSKFRVYFTTNFVDPIGFEKLFPFFLSKTWLQVWCENNNLHYPDTCYLVSPWIFEKLEQVFKICPKLRREDFLQWSNKALVSADKRVIICENDGINFGPLLHPLARGHKIWADYLIENIKI